MQQRAHGIRCGRRDGHRSDDARIAYNSGPRSRADSIRRRRSPPHACRGWWGHAGFAKLEACHLRTSPRQRHRCRAVTSRARSASSSRCSARRGTACASAPGSSRVPRRPSLSGAAPERREEKRGAGLHGDDRAVARRSRGEPSEGREAGDERSTAPVCGGAACRRDHHPERHARARTDGGLDGAQTRPTTAPSLGAGVEPRADRAPPRARLSGRSDHAHQP